MLVSFELINTNLFYYRIMRRKPEYWTALKIVIMEHNFHTEVRLFCHQRGYMSAWEELSPRRIFTKTKQHSSYSGFVENNHFKDGAFYLPCSYAPCKLYMAFKWNQHEQRQGKCNKARFYKGHNDSYQLVTIFWCHLYFKSSHIGMSVSNIVTFL